MKKNSNSGKKSEPTTKRGKSSSTGHRERKEVLAELVGRLRKKLNQKVATASSAEVRGRDGLRPNLDRLTVGVDLGDQWSNYCILDLEGETLAEAKLRTTQADFAEFFQARLQNRLRTKLNPENFRQMGGRMAAVLGYLLDTHFVEPAIRTITVTSDGYLLADADEPRFGCFLGEYRDLIRSWRSLIRVANLRTDERMLAECLFASKIGYFDRTVA